MKFFQKGDIYQVVRITGPTHNVLGIALADDRESAEITVNELSLSGQEIRYLDATAVRDSVMSGVKEGNARFGTAYRVGRIEFCPSDSPPDDVYRFLAASIIERLVRGGNFASQ